MALIYTLKDPSLPTIEQVGGKGLSLFYLGSRGFNVPPIAVLPADFYKPWMEGLKETSQWKAFIRAKEDDIYTAASAVKQSVQTLVFNEQQKKSLVEIRNYLQTEGITLMAVRSSSPEEDLEGASFAGIYETVLGVTDDTLDDAIKTCFVSALDERVVAYKQERGYDVSDPKIAVVIQKQIISEVSGVAFSLNPVTNCYDEVVINANFGLGDTVVEGTVTPDQFMVDNITETILEKVVGKKNLARYVKADGGTETEVPSSPAALSLSDDQVLAISSLTSSIEAEYDKPVDIEWAYEKGQLYLLQARPITGYFQLPPDLITGPGEKKRLYQDALLTEQGLVENLSPLGEGIFDLLAFAMITTLGGDEMIAEKEEGIAFSAAGRIYADVGRMVKLTGKKTTINTFRNVDAVGAEILESLELKEYQPEGLLPPKSVLWNAVKMAFGGIPMLYQALKAYRKPGEYLEYFLEENEKLERDLVVEFEKDQTFDVFSRAAMVQTIEYMNFIALPTLLASERARSSIKKQFKNEPQSIQDQVIYIERAFPHNVTIEMGLLLYELSQFPDVQETATADEFIQKLKHQQHSPEFMEKWGEFIDRYGHRYPKEIDVAAPRYREKPGEVFTIMKNLASSDDQEFNPQGIFEMGIKRRQATVRVLVDFLEEKGEKEVSSFLKKYIVLEAFAAYREIPKYYIILTIDYIRQRILKMAEQWVEDGRLDSAEQVFNLKYDQVVKAEEDPGLDLRQLSAANTAYYGQFNQQLNPPVLIDSRGFIPTLPRTAASENEFTGTPVSPGTVIGPVKLLRRPDEKPVLPGDILVTRATDPGWTTLFLNAGGVLLETGGTLQHGASVARESCKPCIVGLDQITSLLEDGQLVELDGSSGIVTILN